MPSWRLATVKPGPSASRSSIRIVINELLTQLPLSHHEADTYVFPLTLRLVTFKQRHLDYDVSVIISGLGESFKVIPITSHRHLKKKLKQRLRSDASE